jgi:hypothetical protein
MGTIAEHGDRSNAKDTSRPPGSLSAGTRSMGMITTKDATECVAFDRRGHGRSSQPWEGNNYDTFAVDVLQRLKTSPPEFVL